MRQLHLVGATDDKTGLVVADGRGAKAVMFVLPITDELRAALQPGVRRRRRSDGDQGFDSGSSLSPREIQARLRSGRSVDQVAEEAGVAPEWVDRFAGPIVAEQRATLERALALRMDSPRRGGSLRPLGESVVRNLLVKGVRLDDEEIAAGWSAYLYQTGEWVVSFRYLFRRREVTADWLIDLTANTVVALDRTALSLGFIEASGAPAEGSASSHGPGSATGPERGRAAPAAAAARPAAPRSAGASASPTPAKSTGRRRATTEPSPHSDPEQPGSEPPPRARRTRSTPAAESSRARAGQERLVHDRRPPGASVPESAPSALPTTPAVSAGASGKPPPAGEEPAATARPRRRRKGEGGDQPHLPGVE